MLNKKEGPSEDASIPLRKGNKIITGDGGGRSLSEKGEREEKRGAGSDMGGDRREAQRARRMNGNMQKRGLGSRGNL